jgi:hypothetical protein
MLDKRKTVRCPKFNYQDQSVEKGRIREINQQIQEETNKSAPHS